MQLFGIETVTWAVLDGGLGLYSCTAHNVEWVLAIRCLIRLLRRKFARDSFQSYLKKVYLHFLSVDRRSFPYSIGVDGGVIRGRLIRPSGMSSFIFLKQNKWENLERKTRKRKVWSMSNCRDGQLSHFLRGTQLTLRRGVIRSSWQNERREI